MTFNIKEFLSEHGVVFADRGANVALRVCPFCGRDDYKLYASVDKPTFICFVCDAGKGSHMSQLVAKISGMPQWKASKLVAGENQKLENVSKEVYIDDDFRLPTDVAEHRAEIIPMNADVLPTVSMPYASQRIDGERFLSAGYSYCNKRGIDSQMIRKFDIHYSQAMQRIVFPVYMNRRLVGWQARDVTDEWKTNKERPKALSCKGFQKALMLYNYDNVREASEITIVEGAIDAIKCDNIYPVALFGKSISAQQLRLIKDMPNLKAVNIALDPGENHAMSALAKALGNKYSLFVMEFPQDRDAGDCSAYEVAQIYVKRRHYTNLRFY